MKKLSVIILNYHSLALIEECLESFSQHQPNVDYEIIVANNDDELSDFKDFANKHPEIKTIQNTGNWGFASGCNLGASISNAQYLLFLNPDTQLSASPAIEHMVSTLDENPNIGICGCKIIDPNNQEKPLLWNSPWLFIKWFKAIHDILYRQQMSKKFSDDKDIWYPDMISGAALMIGSKDFHALNGWADGKYWMYAEDRDLSYNMVQKLNKKLAQLRRYEIIHAWGGASESSSSLTLDMEMIISRHNFIYHNSRGLSRAIILPTYILKNITTPILKLTLNSLIFNQKKHLKYKSLTFEIISYYLNAIKRGTWKSPRLKK